jgi:multidrug resistance efflux pump
MNRVRLAAVIGLLIGIAALAVVLLRPQGVPLSTERAASGSPNEPGSPRADGPQPAKPIGAPNKAGMPPANANVSDSSHTALLGSVVAPTQATISVRMPAKIREVFAREGETVHIGQAMIDLDETEYAAQEQTARAGEEAVRAQVKKARAGLSAQQVKADADVDTARSGLRQAQNRLQQAKLARQAAADEQKSDLRTALEGVRKAQAGLDRAQETLRGLEELSKVGGVSRTDLEGARIQQRLAQSDLDSAKAQVDRVQAGSDGLPYRVALAQKDVDAAQSGVQQARDGLKTAEEARRQAIKVAEQDVYAAQAALDQAAAGRAGVQSDRLLARLTSPIAGLVTNVGARRGETAQPGASLATVVSLAGLRVEALVPARLLTLFRSGQSASVSVDTAPRRAFNAVVSEIARIAEPDGRTFRVKFRLLGTPPLLPGQTARIRVSTVQQ